MPLVSILVPVYNTAPYLKECVDSLTGQTYHDLQIVFIDDGSTDGSRAILEELARRDKRIEVFSQPNCGVGATRNHLLDKARGEFVLFVDSDDWIELNTVETLLKEQQKDDYDVVSFQISNKLPQDTDYTQEQVVKLFLEHTTFRGSLCDKLIKTHLFEGLQTDPGVYYGEDALLVWQVLQRVKTVRVLGQVLYHYRVNLNSTSRQKFNGKKFTAYTTWSSIVQDTIESWPQYRDIARARFACEMTQILRAAAISGYKSDSSIRLLQEVVRKDGPLIRKTGISSAKMSMYAWLVSRHYWLARQVSQHLR